MFPAPLAVARRWSAGTPRWSILPKVLAVLTLTLTLAACGGAGGDEVAPDDRHEGQGDFPVTIEHKYGSTEITQAPERVVTLGLSDHDVALALGVKPVGIVYWFGPRNGVWPWAQPMWGDTPPEIVGERDDYNVEKVAELTPDLIIAQYSGMTEEQYRTLSELAPVVAQPEDHPDYAAPWQEMTRMIGRALGQEARADELIAETEERFAEVREQYPEFAGQTVAVADTYTPGQYFVFSPDTDPKALFMTELGFRVPEEIIEEAGENNGVEFSSERLDILEVDRLVWLTDATDEERIKADPLYQELEVAQDGRHLFVPYEEPPIGAAVSFNTVLSIPYALDEMLPLLTG